jgi:hypothetical protein
MHTWALQTIEALIYSALDWVNERLQQCPKPHFFTELSAYNIRCANRFCANQPFINPYKPHQPRSAFTQNLLVRSITPSST